MNRLGVPARQYYDLEFDRYDESAAAEHAVTWGKEKEFALSPIRAREMRLCRERTGYEVVPSQHKHLKLRHDGHGDMLLPLRPGDNLSYVDQTDRRRIGHSTRRADTAGQVGGSPHDAVDIAPAGQLREEATGIQLARVRRQRCAQCQTRGEAR